MGFTRRYRGVRSAVVVTFVIALVTPYLLGIRSCGLSLVGELPDQNPPTCGVAVVLAPGHVQFLEQDLVIKVLVFRSPELVDTDGALLPSAAERVIRPTASTTPRAPTASLLLTGSDEAAGQRRGCT